MKKQQFFKDFTFTLDQATTLRQIKKLYISTTLRKFFNDVHIYNLEEKQLFGIILRLKLVSGQIISITNLQRCTNKSFRNLLNLFKLYLDMRSSTYHQQKADQIIFSYHIFSSNYIDEKMNPELQDSIISEDKKVSVIEEKPEEFMKLNHFKLPLTYGYDFPFKFAKLNPQLINDDSIYELDFQNENDKFITRILDKVTKQIKLEFSDESLNRDNLFLRSSGEKEWVIINNKEVVLQRILDFNKSRAYIKTLGKSKKKDRKFLTLDIETYGLKIKNDTQLIPFLISTYNGINDTFKTKFLSKDYDSDMQNLLFELLKKDYNNYKIYIHNLSRFDGIFLLKNVIKLSDKIAIKIEPLIRDGQMLSIKVKYGFKSENKFRY
uniref:DNA polymerase type B n=1 Tax=Amanita inopinata TaxID=933333 RepID=A0A5Q0N246_9AGAR|nr:DNA polymerase type B [Amanita inopinata]QFZ98606.1 DNA polymerase type B [Amanita inopinata]